MLNKEITSAIQNLNYRTNSNQLHSNKNMISMMDRNNALSSRNKNGRKDELFGSSTEICNVNKIAN